MEADFIKRLNRYFHDEEGRFFSDRHKCRIAEESTLYEDFFRAYLPGISENINILDIGSGTGMVGRMIPEGARMLVCADISYEMLKVSKDASEGKREYVVCDAENLPFLSGKFDVITCNAAMHHFPSVENFAREAYRVLAPKGTLVIGYEANRRFWKNPAVAFPYRVLSRIFKSSAEGGIDYSHICSRVNERLMEEKLIGRPMNKGEILSMVDIHSPNAGDAIDYSKAFDVKELLNGPFKAFRAKVYYHYDRKNRLFGLYNKALFPKAASQFSLVLEKKPRIKVLFLFVHLNYGGAEVGLLTTLKNLDKEKFEAVIVSIEKKGAVGEAIEKLGFKVIYLDDDARLFNLKLAGKIARIIRSEKPDVLHTSLFYANFFGRAAALVTRPPVVVTEERSMYTEKRFYHVLIDKALEPFTDSIIVCSKSVLDFTAHQEKIDKSKFSLLYNCVDSDAFTLPETKEALREKYGYGRKDFIIGTVGSLIPKKGHEILIKAFVDIKKSIPEARLLIIGQGPELERLNALSKELAVSASVEFLGPRADVPKLMKLMDVFTLPSFQEGFPRTIIEAMYLGLPVVASNISGIPEVVSDGHTGFLVAPGDIDAIIGKILLIYKDNNIKENFSRNAVDVILKRHMPSKYAKELEGLYLGLLKRKTA